MDIQDIDKKITIVMPVHNTPSVYLNEALDSLKNQSFQKFRLICVDDKSTDNDTIQALQDWSEKYENMEIVYLPEAVGAAEARNIGLRMAEEEYIIFLDSDDIFEKDFLEKMYKRIKESNAQVCICGWEKFSNKEVASEKWKPCINVKKDDEFYLIYQSFNPWSKLCKKDFLIKNNIYFQNLTSCNDLYYSISILLDADSICYIEESLIRYRTLTKHQISSKRNPMNLGYAGKKAMERYECEADSKKRIQILFLIVLAMRTECIIDEAHIQLCNYIKNNLLRHVKFDCIQNKTMKRILSLIKMQDYRMTSVPANFSFEKQLDDNYNELIEQLKQHKEIYLWGIGKRGEAFQKFCKKNRINISAIADSKNNNIGSKNIFGNKVISTNELLKQEGIIVACNTVVYEMIKKSDVRASVLNLQTYCLLSI